MVAADSDTQKPGRFLPFTPPWRGPHAHASGKLLQFPGSSRVWSSELRSPRNYCEIATMGLLETKPVDVLIFAAAALFCTMLFAIPTAFLFKKSRGGNFVAPLVEAILP